MKVLLTTLNAKYIHKNLALRLLYVARTQEADIIEYTIKEDIDKIANACIHSEYDVLAFSVYIWNYEETMQVIKKIKQQCNKHIIVGGPEVSYQIERVLPFGVDAICMGEGEIALWQYIDQLDKGIEKEIVGIYTSQYPNQQFAYVDLKYVQSLENPYFLDFDEESMHTRYFYLETSRGCPYACTYCMSGSDSKVRLFDEDYIFDILQKIASSKIRIVKLLDRTFNVSPERALRIARFMNDMCKNQIFQFEIVAETLSESLLQFFCEEADTSRFRFEVGVQSFHTPTLQAIQRVQDNTRLIQVIQRLVQAKVVLHVDLIAGLPFEDYKTFQTSFNTLFHLHVSEIQLGILKLLKGTTLEMQTEQFEMEFNTHTPYEVIQTKWLSKEEVQLLKQCAYAVEKIYNSKMFRYTIDAIIQLKLYEDPFQFFVEIGKKIHKLKRPYQPHQVVQCIQEVVEKSELLYGLLNYDYYKIHKQKPKLCIPSLISVQTKKEIIQLFIDNKILNKEQLYNYTHIDSIYYQDKLGYQLILYNNKQEYPIRYFIHQKEIEVIV